MCEKNARALIVSYKASNKLISFIEELGIEVILTAESNADKRINDHADLQIFPLDENTYIASKETFKFYKHALKKFDKQVIEATSFVEEIYPKDCPLNVFTLDKYYVTKKDVIDKKLESELQAKGFEPIYQNQAYAKCMTIANESWAITNDMSIYKALKNKDLEVYLISNENIGLDGFKIGFLGGSCGIIDSRKILFTGDISKLKEADKLISILQEKGFEILYPDCELVDLGSIIPVF